MKVDHQRAAAFAAKQHNLIRYDEAIARGVTRHAVRHLVTSGRWPRVLRGVYSTTTGEISPARMRLAAVLSVRSLDDTRAVPVALFGPTALQQWGVDVNHRATDVLRLVVPHALHPDRPPGIQIIRSRTFDADDVLVRAGAPVTRLERAIADSARHVSHYEDFAAIVAESVQNGRTTVDRLAIEADSRRHHRGSALFRRALSAVDRGDRSIAEAALADLISKAGVCEPERGTTLRTAIGPVIPDFLWSDLGLYVEVDGREWHLNSDDWRHDLERQNALSALGLTPLRYTAGDVKRNGPAISEAIQMEIARRQSAQGRVVDAGRASGDRAVTDSAV